MTVLDDVNTTKITLVGETMRPMSAVEEERLIAAAAAGSGAYAGYWPGVAQSDTHMALTAGTAAKSPLQIPAGVVLTAPKAGDLEFDGTVFYLTSADTQRGLVPNHQRVRADAAVSLGNTTNATAMFASANDALTVIAGANYRFKLVWRATTGATSTTLSFLFGGDASFTTINYLSMCVDAASGTAAAALMNNGEAATAVVVGAAGTGVNKRIHIEGEFEVNAAGTIIPQIKFSADPTGTCQTNVGSFFECWMTGANPAVSIGPWA